MLALFGSCGEYKSTIIINAGEGGSVTPAGSFDLTIGNNLNITATADDGWIFNEWVIDGDSISISNIHDSAIKVLANLSGETTLKASFVEVKELLDEDQSYLTVNTSFNCITSPLGKSIVDNTKPHNISADPGSGYSFVAWIYSEDAAIKDPFSSNTTVICLSQNVTISASFESDYEIVQGQTAISLLKPENGDMISYPALSWSLCPDDSTYNIQISLSADFTSTDMIYDGEISGRNCLSTVEFYLSSSWISGDYDILHYLPAGKYFWRVRLKNSLTEGDWATWSDAPWFEREIVLCEIYWDYDESDSNFQGYLYSYDLYGSTEKEDSVIKFNTETDYRFLGASVKVRDQNNVLLSKYTYSSTECLPESKTGTYEYRYQFDNQNRISRLEYYQITDSGESMLHYTLITYELTNLNLVSEKKKFNINADSGEYELFSLQLFEEGKNISTFFYDIDELTGNPIVTYYYDAVYHPIYSDKICKAEYYMLNKTSGELEYYKDYIINYNFPNE